MFLMAMSLIFIVIELRAKFDRSFLIFGFTNLLLSVFCAIDIWLQPNQMSLNLTKIQNAIAAFFPAFLYWYLMLLLRRQNNSIRKLLFLAGFVFASLLFSNLMIVSAGQIFKETLIYRITFVPYMLLAIVFITIQLIKSVNTNDKKNNKVLFYHLLGSIPLSCGGIIDLIGLLEGHRVIPQIISFTTPGALLFGLVVTFVFTERLAIIIRERQMTFAKLQEAYKEMEEVQSLKELGQSTAIINHEIKNYAFIISGYAQYLNEYANLSEKFKKIVNTIGETAVKMSDFSKEILDFSKAKILEDKRPLSIMNLIQNCIQNNFPNNIENIIVEKSLEGQTVHGDWNKLEHVFVNILKNAFEAEATEIKIKSICRDVVILLIVEDNGIGCTKEQLGSLFKSFYTTKKEKGGTGLGMCIIRSIIESHGGYINAYSKNIDNEKEHGLILNISFPLYFENQETLEDKKDPIILINEGLENLATIIRLFQNVYVNPYVVKKADDIDARKIPIEGKSIYGTTETLEKFKNKFGEKGRLHFIMQDLNKTIYVVNSAEKKTIHIFSEKYILENLV